MAPAAVGTFVQALYQLLYSYGWLGRMSCTDVSVGAGVHRKLSIYSFRKDNLNLGFCKVFLVTITACVLTT